MSENYRGGGKLEVGMVVMTNNYTHRRGGNYLMRPAVGKGGLRGLVPEAEICNGTLRVVAVGMKVTIGCGVEGCGYRWTI